jgi:hypothetical protein
VIFQRRKRNSDVLLLRLVQWQSFAGIHFSEGVTGNIS